MAQWLAHPIVAGAITGTVSAALVDFAAFRSWKSAQDALGYQWKLAAWRWFQGAVSGAVAALGLGTVTA